VKTAKSYGLDRVPQPYALARAPTGALAKGLLNLQWQNRGMLVCPRYLALARIRGMWEYIRGEMNGVNLNGSVSPRRPLPENK